MKLGEMLMRMRLSAMRAGDSQIVLCHLLQERREGFATVWTDNLGLAVGRLDHRRILIGHAASDANTGKSDAKERSHCGDSPRGCPSERSEPVEKRVGQQPRRALPPPEPATRYPQSPLAENPRRPASNDCP